MEQNLLKKKNICIVGRFENDFENQLRNCENNLYWSFSSYKQNENINNDRFQFLNTFNSNLEYIFDAETVNGEKFVFSNITTNSEELESQMYSWELKSYRYYICKLNSLPITNMESLKYEGFNADQTVFSKLDVYLRVNSLEKSDVFKNNFEQYKEFAEYGILYIGFAITCFIIGVFCLIYLTKNLDKDKKILFDRLYNEELVLILITILYVIYRMMSSWIFTNLRNEIKWIIAIAGYYILYNVYMAIVKLIKRNEISKNFIIGNSLKDIRGRHLPLVLWIIILFISVMSNEFDIMMILILLGTELCIRFFCLLIELSKIENRIKNLSTNKDASKYECRVAMFDNLSESIDNLQVIINEQVQNSIKSERLKADLITNVSHDLKTPITSIINYIQLLKKENIQNSKAVKYIEVLEKKSGNLKNLTDDLIDISKLTSGNETVNLERLNISEIIMQANGEFEEKFEEKNLKLVSSFSSDEIYGFIDSKKMWRVLENLYTNIYKYAQENSRVYVDVREESNKIKISLKNISKEELNIDSNELLERFVRVDKSRNISGNGLGLSIAKELVNLQNGEFKISIDGDLFRIDIVI